MRWAFYCNDGSPIGVAPPDINGRGVGGAELALMSLTRALAEAGHEVRVYNDPIHPGQYDGVLYTTRTNYDNTEDVFVLFRSPNPTLHHTNAAVKLFWSCDQYTQGTYSKDIFPYVDRIVCISPFHVQYHLAQSQAPQDRIGYIDLGVRVEDYDQQVERVPYRCIFCSVPDRGLSYMHMVWPMVKAEIPEATLVITSDYRLWGAGAPLNDSYRAAFVGVEGVDFMGCIPRPQLVQEQMRAELLTYPSIYMELFCLAVAEAQVAGAVPISTGTGAIPTTLMKGMLTESLPVPRRWWYRRYADLIVDTLRKREALASLRAEMQLVARKRFDWHVIAGEWEHLVETGEFPCV